LRAECGCSFGHPVVYHYSSFKCKKFLFGHQCSIDLFAAGLVARGIHEFNEAGLLPAVVENIWDTNHILNEGSTTGSVFVALFGYNGNPSLTEVIVYFCYLLLVWVLFYKAVIPIQRSDHKIETKNFLDWLFT